MLSRHRVHLYPSISSSFLYPYTFFLFQTLFCHVYVYCFFFHFILSPFFHSIFYSPFHYLLFLVFSVMYIPKLLIYLQKIRLLVSLTCFHNHKLLNLALYHQSFMLCLRNVISQREVVGKHSKKFFKEKEKEKRMTKFEKERKIE